MSSTVWSQGKLECATTVKELANAESRKAFSDWVRNFKTERFRLAKELDTQKKQLSQIYEESKKPGSPWSQLKNRKNDYLQNTSRDLRKENYYRAVDGFENWLQENFIEMNSSFSKERESLSYRTYHHVAGDAIWHRPEVGGKPLPEPKEARKKTLYDTGWLKGPNLGKVIFRSQYKGENTITIRSFSTTDAVFGEDTPYAPYAESTLDLETGEIKGANSLAFTNWWGNDESELTYSTYLTFAKRKDFPKDCLDEINALGVNPFSSPSRRDPKQGTGSTGGA